MRKASVLVPLHNNLTVAQLCLTNAISKTGLGTNDFEVLLYNNGSSDPGVKTWAHELLKKHENIQYYESVTVKPNSQVLNELLSNVTNEFICIIPYPTFVPENWLFDLVSTNAQIVNSGISCIPDHKEKGILTPKITESETFCYVYQTLLNLVTSGVFCFHSAIIEAIGGFDPEMNQGYEYMQFAYRVSNKGFLNYYLCGPNATTTYEALEPITFFETSQAQFDENIIRMIKNKSWVYKITTMPDREQKARAELPALMQKFGSIRKEEFYMELSETWGFELIGFSMEEAKYLDEFCIKFGLQWIVLPGGKKLQRSMSINFYERK